MLTPKTPDCEHEAIGFNVETVQYKNLKLQVWDLGGQTSIRPYWRCVLWNTRTCGRRLLQVELESRLCAFVAQMLLREHGRWFVPRSSVARLLFALRVSALRIASRVYGA